MSRNAQNILSISAAVLHMYTPMGERLYSTGPLSGEKYDEV